ncbi:MAG: DUF1552 domain-containing protein [Nannocystales bacterium]
MKLIKRRNFVRGFGLTVGAVALTPMARSLVAQANGDAVTQKRWVLLHDQHGLQGVVEGAPERWVPSSANLTAAGALSPSFAPLAPWAADMIIADRFYNPYNAGQHGNHWASLSADGIPRPDGVSGGAQSAELYPNAPTGLTVDVAAARHLSAGAPFEILAAGTDSGGFSADENLHPIGYSNNPVELFARVFGEFDPTASEAEIQARLESRLSVLDTVVDDLSRIRSRLASEERLKLDQYEDSIRGLENQLTAISGLGDCSVPEAPVNSPTGPIGAHNDALPAGYWNAQIGVLSAALRCRLTNVVVFRPSPGRRTYSELFGWNDDKHDTSHGDPDVPDPLTGQLQSIDAYNASLLARLLTDLEEVEEGNGTMRDSTLATWLDEGGGIHHHGYNDHPAILIGNLDGHFDTGRYVQYTKMQHCISDLYVSILQSLGVDVDTFGNPETCIGALPGLT